MIAKIIIMLFPIVYFVDWTIVNTGWISVVLGVLGLWLLRNKEDEIGDLVRLIILLWIIGDILWNLSTYIDWLTYVGDLAMLATYVVLISTMLTEFLDMGKGKLLSIIGIALVALNKANVEYLNTGLFDAIISALYIFGDVLVLGLGFATLEKLAREKSKYGWIIFAGIVFALADQSLIWGLFINGMGIDIAAVLYMWRYLLILIPFLGE